MMARCHSSATVLVLVALMLHGLTARASAQVPPSQPGWPVDYTHFLCAMVGSMNGSDPVVVGLASVAFDPLLIEVLGADGQVVVDWPDPQFPSFSVGRQFTMIADMTGDGVSEIIAVSHTGNSVHVFDGTTGQRLQFSPIRVGEGTSGPQSSCMGDLDGDGDYELIAIGREGQDVLIYVFDGDGTQLPGWPRVIGGYGVGAGVAVGDVDFDGFNEVVVSTRRSVGGSAVASPVHVFDRHGEYLPGWPAYPDGSYGFMGGYPRIADLDGDGFCEIVGTAGQSMPVMSHDGQTRTVWYHGGFGGRCAIGDVTGDGRLNIVAGVYGSVFMHTLGHSTGPSYINPEIGLTAGWSIADFDGDGLCEIVFRGNLGHEHNIMVTNSELEPLPGFPIHNPYDLTTTESKWITGVADLDGDNDLELVYAENWGIQVLDFPNPSGNPVKVEWTGIDGQPSRSGYYHEDKRVERFIRGDANGDSQVDIADIVLLFRHFFLGADVPCQRALDIDDDEVLSLPDGFLLTSLVFGATHTLPHPYPRCGCSHRWNVVSCETPLVASACP